MLFVMPILCTLPRRLLGILGMAEKNEERIPVRRHRLPGVETYEVMTEELDSLEQESMRVGEDFSFGAVSLAVAISFLITLLTVKIESSTKLSIFFAILICGSVFTLYFGIRWRRGRCLRKTTIQRIRERAIGPLGEEGKEIKPMELAELPAEEAGKNEPEQ